MKFSEPPKYLRDIVRISTRKDAGLAIREILPVRPAHASLDDRFPVVELNSRQLRKPFAAVPQLRNRREPIRPASGSELLMHTLNASTETTMTLG